MEGPPSEGPPMARPPFLRVIATSFALLVASSLPRATVLDPAFTESTYVFVPIGSSGATGMAWAPDGSGRLFVLLKDGTVWIVQAGSPPTVLSTPFAVISPIYTGSECGLIGMAFDPAFVVNHYVYFFVTVSSSE